MKLRISNTNMKTEKLSSVTQIYVRVDTDNQIG